MITMKPFVFMHTDPARVRLHTGTQRKAEREKRSKDNGNID